MICAVHQPNYIPYLGFFDKYKKADIFVLYDTAQYSKNDYHNRNKIKIQQGSKWLTIPVAVHLGQKVREAKIADQNFVGKHLSILKQAYGEADYFKDTFPKLEQLYRSLRNEFLVDVTIPLLQYFFDIIDDQKRVVLASELEIDPSIKNSAALIAMCKKLGAHTYVSGVGAKEYLDPHMFAENDINVVWQDFEHPSYKQVGGGFVPYMSVVDAYCNLGSRGVQQILENIQAGE